MSILIIGGDAKLSKELKKKLISNKIDFIETSKKNKNNSDKIIYLDYEDIESFSIPEKIEKAVVVAYISSYEIFERNQDYSKLICTVKIPYIVEQLLMRNIYTCFISSNAVFSDTKSIPSEYDTTSPSFHYGIYKSKTEEAILRISEKLKKNKFLSILRLTKNVSNDSSPFNQWIKNINKKNDINVFKDLYFSPILFQKSAEVVFKLLSNQNEGIFHFSGKSDISYYDFADGFFNFANINKELINISSPKKLNIKIHYKNHITSLNMKITQDILNIKPMELLEIYSYLKKFIRY